MGSGASGAQKSLEGSHTTRAAEASTKAGRGATVADGASKTDQASKSLDGAEAALAGGAAQKAIGGKGDSAARRRAGRYAGSATSGAIGGAKAGAAAGGVGALPGAAAGLAKGVATEGGTDVAKGASKALGGGSDAVSADQRRLGAGGTGYARTSGQEEESTGKKVAKGTAAAGTVAAVPPVGMMLTLMALFKFLKTLVFQMAAAAANLWGAALGWMLGVGKAVGSFIAAPFVTAGGMISAGVAALIGVTLAPAVAIGSAVTASLAALAMLAGFFFSGIAQPVTGGNANANGQCVVNAGGGGGYETGPIDPTQLAHAQAVYSILKGQGMPDENIAGILGNWSQESGVDPTSVEGIFDEPYRVGPRKRAKVASGSGFGIGLGQWTADRNVRLKDYAERKGKNWWNLGLQLQFMADPTGDNPSDVKIFKGMITTSLGSPREAAIYFEQKWERAGVVAIEARIAAAERWYDEMQNWDGFSGSSGSSADVEQVDTSEADTTLNLGQVKPHVQEAAEHIYSRFSDGVYAVGGYREERGPNPGDHPKGLAVDFMVELNSSGRATGDEMAAYIVENHEALNVQYVIWYQQIWNADRADEGWRDMANRGSQTQNHKDHNHVSFKPSGRMGDVPGPGTGECEGGGSQNVALVDGGMDMASAEAFMDEYNRTGDAFLRNKYHGGGPGQCEGSYIQNCVSFSVYFLNKYTSFTQYPAGNGKDTAAAVARMSGKTASATPTPYSVFSHGNSSAAGHTGIVLGIDGDRLLIGEAAYCSFAGRARWVEASEWQNKGWTFVDVSDLVKEDALEV